MSEKNNATIDDAKKTVEYLKQITVITNSNSEKIDDFLKQLENKMNSAIEEINKSVDTRFDALNIEVRNQILEDIHNSIGKLLSNSENEN